MLELDEARQQRILEVVLAAVVGGVPGYRRGFDREGESEVTGRVRLALDTFIRAAPDDRVMDDARAAAFELGELQARAGQGLDELLAAYRVGAAAAWNEYADAANAAGLGAREVGELASSLFSFVDEISAASVAGHANAVSSAQRLLARARERFATLLVQEADKDELREAAAAAGRPIPSSVTVVVSGRHDLARTLSACSADSLAVSPELSAELAMVVVPDLDDARRRHLVAELDGIVACVGPTLPVHRAGASHRLAQQAWSLGAGEGSRDSMDHLVGCLVSSDSEAADLLWREVMAPLSGLSSRKSETLALTLRSWLLNLGQRGAVAHELGVHPQTVRYRMDQVRELFGSQLSTPAEVERLIVCLCARAFVHAGRNPLIAEGLSLEARGQPS